MADLSCACSTFGKDTETGEIYEPCTAPATQEDLLCDSCREWKQTLRHGLESAIGHNAAHDYALAMTHYAKEGQPHRTYRDEDLANGNHDGITEGSKFVLHLGP